jgi:hypothetical protein
MKKSPTKTHPRQTQFDFASERSFAPGLHAQTMCCSSLPQQRTHPIGCCFADRLPAWLKPAASIRKTRFSDGELTNQFGNVKDTTALASRMPPENDILIELQLSQKT